MTKKRATVDLGPYTEMSSKAPPRWWNYRIFKEDGEFSIREVHYENGVPYWYTGKPAYPYGETVAKLKRDLEAMLRALDHDVFTPETFKKAK